MSIALEFGETGGGSGDRDGVSAFFFFSGLRLGVSVVILVREHG